MGEPHVRRTLLSLAAERAIDGVSRPTNFYFLVISHLTKREQHHFIRKSVFVTRNSGVINHVDMLPPPLLSFNKHKQSVKVREREENMLEN